MNTLIGNKTNLRYTSPFSDPSATLQETLAHNHIRRLIDWTITSDCSLITQASNSHWESAVIMNFLMEADKIYKERRIKNEKLSSLEKIAGKVYSWLVNNTKASNNPQHLSWDDCTWDTGVVISSFCRALDYFGMGVFEDKHIVFEVLNKSLEWLRYLMSIWETDVKYQYGPADVAKLLLAFLYIYDSKFSAHIKMSKDEIHSVIEAAVQYLIKIKSEVTYNGCEDKCYLWGDEYQTAEVGEALTLYIAYLHSKHADSARIIEIESIVRNIVHGFEVSQVEGMWGNHQNTLKCLSAYVYISYSIPKIDTEPHIVFKTLRYMCDSKQNFDDGSYLHTSFLTVYFAQSIIVMYKYWELSTHTIYDIYDHAFWASSSVSSTERSATHALGMEISRKEASNQEIKSKLYILRATLFSIPVVIIAFILLCILGVWDISLVYDATKVDLLAIVVGVATSVIGGMIAIAAKVSNKKDN